MNLLIALALLTALITISPQAMRQQAAPSRNLMAELSEKGLPIQGATSLERCYLDGNALGHVFEGELKERGPQSTSVDLKGLHHQPALPPDGPFLWQYANERRLLHGVIAVTPHTSPIYKTMFDGSVDQRNILSILASALKNIVREIQQPSENNPSVILEGISHTGISITTIIDLQTRRVKTFYPTASQPGTKINLPETRAFCRENYVAKNPNECRKPIDAPGLDQLIKKFGSPISAQRSIVTRNNQIFLVPTSQLKSAAPHCLAQIRISRAAIHTAFTTNNDSFPLNRTADDIIEELHTILAKIGCSQNPVAMRQGKQPNTLYLELPGFHHTHLIYRITMDSSGLIQRFSVKADIPKTILHAPSGKNQEN